MSFMGIECHYYCTSYGLFAIVQSNTVQLQVDPVSNADMKGINHRNSMG